MKRAVMGLRKSCAVMGMSSKLHCQLYNELERSTNGKSEAEVAAVTLLPCARSALHVNAFVLQQCKRWQERGWKVR